jgi:acyl-CoA thioester hydrolase
MTQATTEVKRAPAWLKKDFAFFESITLRWADNDSYGHINNAHYYSFFDTAVDAFLLKYDLRKHLAGIRQTLVVASECRYFKQVTAPGWIRVGVRVGKIGKSSITYEVAVFVDEYEDAAAQGLFVHVCVERASQRPTSLSTELLDALKTQETLKVGF